MERTAVAAEWFIARVLQQEIIIAGDMRMIDLYKILVAKALNNFETEHKDRLSFCVQSLNICSSNSKGKNIDT
jgi:hypothetical protein